MQNGISFVGSEHNEICTQFTQNTLPISQAVCIALHGLNGEEASFVEKTDIITYFRTKTRLMALTLRVQQLQRAAILSSSLARAAIF